MNGVESEHIVGDRTVGRAYPIAEDGENIYCAAVSPDGKYVALAFGNGVLRILESTTFTTLARSPLGPPFDDNPSTCVKWLDSEGDTYSLLSVSSAGGVFQWEWDSELLQRTRKVCEEKNETITLDISADGKSFLTAGSDRVIRVYDTASFTVRETLSRGVDNEGQARPTHTNRIFSVRYITPMIAASAGWESPIQLWDLRTSRSHRQVFGTQPSCDCIEPFPGTSLFLVSSNRSEQQLQVFDSVTGDEISHQSETLCRQLNSSARILLARVCTATGKLWCITAKPYTVLILSLSSGDVLGTLSLPVAPLSVTLHSQFPNQAIVSCMKSQLILVKLSS